MSAFYMAQAHLAVRGLERNLFPLWVPSLILAIQADASFSESLKFLWVSHSPLRNSPSTTLNHVGFHPQLERFWVLGMNSSCSRSMMPPLLGHDLGEVPLLRFVHHKSETILLVESEWSWHEWMHAEPLLSCLAHSKPSITVRYYHHARNILEKKMVDVNQFQIQQRNKQPLKLLLFMAHILHFLRHKQPFHSIIVSKLVQKRECAFSFSMEISSLEVDHPLNPASVNV